MIRVLIAEDQAMVRGALVSLLSLEGDIEVVAEVARGDAVLEAARRTTPDVALLDIEMPGLDGISAGAEVVCELPGIRVLILTTFGRPGYLRRALEEGASGFLLKDAPARELAAAVRAVHAGLRAVDPALAAEAIADGTSPLTPREEEVLVASARHGSAAEIAAALHLSEGTVRNYLSAAMRKLGARNRSEAVDVATEKRWLRNLKPAPMLTYTAVVALETGQAVRPVLDVRRLRDDFPILEREINGHPLAYLDSASSTQKPQAVIDSLVHTYSHSYANVHRGVYTLAEETTARYERARETVRGFLGARSTREIIFVRDTTEGLNLVAYAWGRKHLKAGDVIVATEMEHHSNLVPWQFLANQTGALMRYVKVDDDGALDLASLEAAADDGPVRLVAAVHVSNSLGTVNPIEELGAWCRAHDAVLVVDGAQSAPHRPIDVQALGVDFFAFSGHKLGGPGSGALYGREERLDEMDPFLTGGEMISRVTLESTSWNDLPYKFEAGTPAIAENIALGAAIDYLTGVGIEAVAQHERELTAYAYERLAAVPDLRILGPGPGADRGAVLSFALPDIHPHDLAAELDRYGIAVRAGHHCTQPAMRRFGVPATTRASFWLYSLPEEIDRLIDGIELARKAFS